MKYIITILISTLFIGCAVIPPSKGIYAGNNALAQKNHEQAVIYYSSALDLAIQQNHKPHIASAKYGLGRAYGQLCNFQLAEKNFKEAVAIEEKILSGDGMHLTQDYFELARLYYEYSEFENSIIYFKKAIPLVEAAGIEHSDPIGYANVLKDYIEALARTNNTRASESIQSKINKLIKQNPGKAAGFKITHINQACMLNK